MMIVDALMLLGENRFGPSLSPDEALSAAERLGLDRVIAAPARPLDYRLEPANEQLAKAAAASGGRIATLGRVDPTDGDRAVAEAKRCLNDLGCVGLFLHPGEEAFPITTARNVLDVARAGRAPVVVATGLFSVSEPLQVAQVASDFPEVQVVMTNGANINISGLSLADAWLALRSAPNLLVMTNGEYRQDFIERLARDLEPGRALYASMAPIFDPGFELKRVRSARMSDEVRRGIEGENAAQLFCLS
ncbi:MAG: amidohydrolase family protein [Actinomycetota bacterium]